MDDCVDRWRFTFRFNTMKLEEATRLIQQWDAVALLGAGLSYDAGMPLANELPPLLWSTFDEHPRERAELASHLSVPDAPARTLIAFDSARVAIAFEAISARPPLRFAFQRIFCALNAARVVSASPVHDAVARLIYHGKIELAISLNWDTLVESAYQRMFGPPINLPRTRLYKPHGDVANPASPWLLPVERHQMPRTLLDHISAMVQERPRILVVIGYGERDEYIIEQIVKPLEARWQVIRFSPSARGPGAICPSANFSAVIPELANRLCPTHAARGWEFVTFDVRRDIGPAIAGERLSPADIYACPRLPIVDELTRQLRRTHVVRLEGEPGSGKSITAYQAAFDRLQDGYHVLQLSEPPDPAAARDSFSQMSIRSLFIVDDAQRYSAGFIRALEERTHPNRELLVVSTKIEDAPAFRVTAAESVDSVAAEYRRRRNEILEHVRLHDPEVGDRYFDDSIEARIERAARERTLWHFSYVLRGGWRLARRLLDETRDIDRADLLLIGIAAMQLLGLDAPVPRSSLNRIAAAFERAEPWIESSLDCLLQKRLVISGRGGWRCHHLAFSYELLEKFAQQPFTAEHRLFGGLLRHLILESLSLRGILWVIAPVRWGDSCYARHGPFPLLTAAILEPVLARCFTSTSQDERGAAATLIDVSMQYADEALAWLRPQINLIARWINESDGAADGEFGWFINDVYNTDAALARGLVELLDPDSLSRRLSTIQPSQSIGLCYLINRAAIASCERTRQRLAQIVQQAALDDFARRHLPAQLHRLMGAAANLSAIAPNVDERLVAAAEPAIDQAYSIDPVGTFAKCREFVDQALGRTAEILRIAKMTPQQVELGRRLVKGACASRLAEQIIDERPRYWDECSQLLSFLSKVDKEKLQQVVSRVDLVALENKVGEEWAEPVRELRLLISALHAGQQRDQRISKWLYQQRERVNRLDPLFLYIAPDLAAYGRDRSIPIDIHGHNGRNWGLAAGAIVAVYRKHPAVALSLLAKEKRSLLSTMEKPEGIDLEIGLFVRLIADIRPRFVGKLLSRVNWEQAAPKWRAMEGTQRGERALRHLRKAFRACGLEVPQPL